MPPLHAAPGDTLFSDDFETGYANWTATALDGGVAGVDSATASSGVNSMFTAGGAVRSAMTASLDLSVASSVSLKFWARRGDTSFSDRPESGDDLVVEYLDAGGTWQTIVVFVGGWPPGKVFTPVISLPPAALHAGFRLAFRQTDGQTNGAGIFDYWHIDDVSIFEPVAPGLAGVCWDFTADEGDFTGDVGPGNGGRNGDTFQSAPMSLFLQGGRVRNSTDGPDTSNKDVRVSFWIRRGAAIFSDSPEAGEDLEAVYYGSNNAYNLIETFPGNGTPGETFQREYLLPANASHNNFSLRFTLLNGNESGGDYWHIDDVCVLTSDPADHLAIVHDGSAVNCQAEPVRIEAHTTNHNIAAGFTGTVTLATSTSHGDWSALDAQGTLVNNSNGAGTYQFVAADNGTAVLGLRNTFVETINIDAAGGGVAVDASEDPDLVYSSTGFQFVTAGTDQPVGSQIAGKPSSTAPTNAVELQAIRSSDSTGACEAAFVDATAVDLAMSCETPGTCAGVVASINGSSIATGNTGTPSSWTSLSLDFGDAADNRAPVVFRYDDAGSVKLHARKILSPSGEIMSGASLPFTVRPFGFDIAADQGSITATNPAAATPGGAGFERAGRPFRSTVRAVAWAAADDIDNDGIPDGHTDGDASNNADLSDNVSLPNFAREPGADNVILTHALIAPAGGYDPGLDGTTQLTGFMAGSTSTDDLDFDEVGSIELRAALQDNNYLGAGAITGRSGPVGRFTADHFETSVASHGCNTALGFGYSAQPFQSLELSARNFDGLITQNYSWDTVNDTGFAKDHVLSDPAATPAGSFSGGVAKESFADGVATLTDTIHYAFSTVPRAPYALVVRTTDTDAADSSGHAEGSSEIRSARLALFNAAAPVYHNASGLIEVQQWDGTDWQTETGDTCTEALLSTAAVSYANFTDTLDSGESLASSVSLNAGQGAIIFSAPGTGNAGRMDALLDVPVWLEFDWNGNGAEDPSGAVLFLDNFSHEPGFIHSREIVMGD
jgi:hypothetical protein